MVLFTLCTKVLSDRNHKRSFKIGQTLFKILVISIFDEFFKILVISISDERNDSAGT